MDYIKDALHHPSDLVVKKMNSNMALIYIETLIDDKKLVNQLMMPLSDKNNSVIGTLAKGEVTTDLNHAVQVILEGDTLLCRDGDIRMHSFKTGVIHERNIEEPPAEMVVQGSHEGFVENMKTNLGLLRKKIENKDLCVKYYQLGKKTKTNAAIVYMNDLASDEIIKEVEHRLESIDVDILISPAFIQELIEDVSLSPFPQLLNTERPDRVVANLLERRIALLANGSSTVLLFPVTFFTFFQSPGDYSSRWMTGSYIRLLRFISFLLAIMLPSFYISVSSFHFEMIPQELVLPLKSSVDGIPYPPIVEALFMVITVELIREAGIRLPSPVGQTIGIVGGLVIGNAVVEAGLISNIMIIIIALTAIASFVVPSNEMSTAIRVLTFPLMLMASMFGFVGIVFILIMLLIHLCSLDSFGSPYLLPLAPFKWNVLKDTFIRLPMSGKHQRYRKLSQQYIPQHFSRRSENE